MFNSLRRVILDKSFNDQYTLPDNMIVTAAMNPTDKLTQELTGHVKDAIDIIDAQPSWEKLQEYLDNGADQHNRLTKIPEAVRSTARQVLDAFSAKFTLQKPEPGIGPDTMRFYLKIGEGDVSYMSPREWTALYVALVHGLNRAFKEAKQLGADELEPTMASHLTDKIEHQLQWVLRKHGIDSPQYMEMMAQWVVKSMPMFLEKRRSEEHTSELQSH